MSERPIFLFAAMVLDCTAATDSSGATLCDAVARRIDVRGVQVTRDSAASRGAFEDALADALSGQRWGAVIASDRALIRATDAEREVPALARRLAARRWAEPPPELVFLDIDHIGRTGPPTAEAAGESVVALLLWRGVRCVVAPAGAVDPAAAEHFVSVFFEALGVDGLSAEGALHRARSLNRLAHPKATAWAVYQAWGDPDWRLPGAE